MSRVFVPSAPVNPLIINPDGLREFGTPVTLFPSGHNILADPQATYTRVVRALREDYREGDYLTWVGGNTLLAFLTGAALREIQLVDKLVGHEWKWLRYVGETTSYRSITVALGPGLAPDRLRR